MKKKKKIRSLGYRCSHSVLTWFFQGTRIVVVTGRFTFSSSQDSNLEDSSLKTKFTRKVVLKAYVLDQKSFRAYNPRFLESLLFFQHPKPLS